MNNALEVMTVVFKVSKTDTGFIQRVLQSSLYVGSIIGSILGLFILRIGLRKCLILIDLFMIGGASLLSIDNLYIFLAGRVLMGVGCGIAPSMASYYLIQYCPKELYGLIGGLNPIL
jgi:MFS family permease